MQSSVLILRASDNRIDIFGLDDITKDSQPNESAGTTDTHLTETREEYTVKKILKEFLSTLNNMKTSGNFDDAMFTKILEALESSLLIAIAAASTPQAFEEILLTIDNQELQELISFSCEFHRKVYGVIKEYLQREHQLASSSPEWTGKLLRLMHNIRFRGESLAVYEALKVIWNDIELNLSVIIVNDIIINKTPMV